jgi:hypothetical protein
MEETIIEKECINEHEEIIEHGSSFNMFQINNIRKTIECMNKFNQIEVLRILKNSNVTLNENNYGVFINLTNLDYYALKKLDNYIEYVKVQENNLNNIEKQKENYINTYF